MKFILKIGAHYVAIFILLPLILGQRISNKFTSKDRVFHSISQVLSLVPSRLGVYLRAAFYSNVCNSVDREISVGFFTLFSHVDLDIGKNVYIGSQCNIGSCAIGNDCLLGSGVHVLSGKQQHNFSDSSKPIRLQSGSFIKVKIGENCWIGNQACILADVGSHSIVAAGSVVVTDVPANSIVAGNPAKIIKKR